MSSYRHRGAVTRKSAQKSKSRTACRMVAGSNPVREPTRHLAALDQILCLSSGLSRHVASQRRDEVLEACQI